MKHKNISKSNVYVQEASAEVYRKYEHSAGENELFVVSIDGGDLKTPKGIPIASSNKQAMRELAAELDYSDELNIGKISLYNLLCTQLDFPVDLEEFITFDSMVLFLLNDPVLRTCAGPEVRDQLKYLQTVISYLDDLDISYPSLPQVHFSDPKDESWVTPEFEKLVNHVRSEIKNLSEVDRSVFITALNVFDSPLLALLLVKDEITNHEFAVLYLTGLCVNSKVWPDSDREKEKNAKMEISRDVECIVRYKRLFEKKPSEVENLIKQGESRTLEFKSTLRVNLHTNEADPRIEHASLKTIAAFLNTAGGTLLIGVSDDGKYVGIDTDKFKNEDKFQLHFKNLLKSGIGLAHSEKISWDLVQFNKGKILRVICEKSDRPVFLNTKDGKKFYIRTGPSTDELMAEELINYTAEHFSEKQPE